LHLLVEPKKYKIDKYQFFKNKGYDQKKSDFLFKLGIKNYLIEYFKILENQATLTGLEEKLSSYIFDELNK